MPPTDHLFEDPERSRLIEKIWESVKDYPTTHKVTFCTVQACLWLLDMEMLREMIGKMKERNEGQAMHP